jgi:hypothetical protein
MQRILGIALVVVGIGMIISAFAHGAHTASLGVIIGALFAALGVARLLLAHKTNAKHQQ